MATHKSNADKVRTKRPRQRSLQRAQDIADIMQGRRAQAKAKVQPPVQIGARHQPATMPAQHVAKPSHALQLALAPRFAAPVDDQGSRKLAGKIALITGGDSGIGRAVAVLFAKEGADVAIVYLDEHDDAKDTKRLVEAEGRQCDLIPTTFGTRPSASARWPRRLRCSASSTCR